VITGPDIGASPDKGRRNQCHHQQIGHQLPALILVAHLRPWIWTNSRSGSNDRMAAVVIGHNSGEARMMATFSDEKALSI
jgi:hypothetical protein